MLILSFIIAFILSGLHAWLLFRADKKRAVPYPWLTAGLRGLLTFLCLVLLLAPKVNKTNTSALKPIVLLLQDHSQSIPIALGKDSIQFAQNCQKLSQQLSNQYRFIHWNLDGPLAQDSSLHYNAPTTNLTQAIEKASELYGAQNLSAIILASDGWYNEGNNPLYTTLPLNTSLYSIALGDTTRVQDIRISKVFANKTASLNSQWEVNVSILAERCAGKDASIQLLDAQQHVVASSPIHINADRFTSNIAFRIPMNKAGLQQFSLHIPVLDNEANRNNNKSSVLVEVVEEKKKILILAAAPHPDIHAITDALKGLDQYIVEVKMMGEMPVQCNDYAAIVLHQLPSNNSKIPESLLVQKNIWFIAGAQNNYYMLNEAQSCVQFGAFSNGHAAEPILEKGFSAFSIPNNIAAIGDALPPLNVYSSNTQASARANVLWKDASGKALWSILSGKQTTAVLSGEGLWRWRLYEYKNTQQHQVVDECIRQTIAYLSADQKHKKFRTELSKLVWHYPEHINVNAFLYNDNNELLNTPEASISIKDSTQKERKFNFERNGNSYRIDVGTLGAGTYLYTAQTTFEGKKLIDAGKFIVDESSIELQETGCNYPLLYSLAQQNNGCTFGINNMLALVDTIAHNNNIKPLLHEEIESTDLIEWKWIFFLIVLVASTEWLLRKYWMAM